MDLDRQRLEWCLEQLLAFRASGLSATAWAVASGVQLRVLQRWCAHSKRWRTRLDGVVLAPSWQPIGFVAAWASMAPPAPASTIIRVDPGLGASCRNAALDQVNHGFHEAIPRGFGDGLRCQRRDSGAFESVALHTSRRRPN